MYSFVVFPLAHVMSPCSSCSIERKEKKKREKKSTKNQILYNSTAKKKERKTNNHQEGVLQEIHSYPELQSLSRPLTLPSHNW